jgi:hypothetical protein
MSAERANLIFNYRFFTTCHQRSMVKYEDGFTSGSPCRIAGIDALRGRLTMLMALDQVPRLYS